MNDEQSAYVKSIAHKIEMTADSIKLRMQAVQGDSLIDDALIAVNFQDVTYYCEAMQRILADDLPKLPPTYNVLETEKIMFALLKNLPVNYPPAKFGYKSGGYWLEIDNTSIFRDCSCEDAVKHTRDYVDARDRTPNLPVGVIYGLYN